MIRKLSTDLEPPPLPVARANVNPKPFSFQSSNSYPNGFKFTTPAPTKAFGVKYVAG